MLWGVSSLVTLLLNSAVVQALRQRDLGDLLSLGPELDDPILASTQSTRHTEQASTPSRIERTTSPLSQLTTRAAQPTTSITGVPSYPYLKPTQAPTLRLPIPTPEVNDTHTTIIATSTSQNVTTSTGYPSPPPPDLELPQGHTVDWRVIGIAVIAVSVVGTMILAIVFFDQWWGFLCDVGGHRRKWRGGKEELVPDWERGSWVFKVEDDNLPACPSFGSPPTVQMQERVATHPLSPKVDMDHRPVQNTSHDYLGFPPVGGLNDNGQTQGVPYAPSRRQLKQFSPSGVVHEVTAYKLHSPLSRSDTQKSTASEDAYGGLAV